jgi:hypothetical protein
MGSLNKTVSSISNPTFRIPGWENIELAENRTAINNRILFNM